MRIGVLIPDRNDRPRLLENCLRMIKKQSLQPELIEIVNDKSLNNDCDITWRYRIGYDRLRNKNLEMIALIENDDWYHEDYLKIMCEKYIEHGKPDIIGTTCTTYYHIKEFAYFNMYHSTRSSAMSTLIRPDLNLNWTVDNDPYTDIHLWLHNKLKGITFDPGRYICLGIKHGEGKCGGQNHFDKMERYINLDHDKTFLKSILDPESFEFYSNYFNNK